MDGIIEGGGQPQSLPAVMGDLGVLAAGKSPLEHSHVWEDVVGDDPSRLLEVLDNDVSTAEMAWEATINGHTTNAQAILKFVSCTVTSGAFLSSDSNGVCVSEDGLYRQTVTGRIVTENGVVGIGDDDPVGIWVGSVKSHPTGEVIEIELSSGSIRKYRAFTEADGLVETQVETSLGTIERGGNTYLYGPGTRNMKTGASQAGSGNIDVLPIASYGSGTGTGKVRYIEKLTIKRIH